MQDTQKMRNTASGRDVKRIPHMTMMGIPRSAAVQPCPERPQVQIAAGK